MTVLLLVSAMLSLSLMSSDMRQTHRQNLTQRARENAQLALHLAIAELQESAGPDQRVTANAQLVNDELAACSQILGVFHTADTTTGRPLIDQIFSENQYKDAYEDRRSSENWQRLDSLDRWLVSGHPQHLDQLNEMLKKSSMTIVPAADGHQEVQAPLVRVGEGGAYAWWISDCQQKASLDNELTQLERQNQLAMAADLSVLPATDAVISSWQVSLDEMDAAREGSENGRAAMMSLDRIGAEDPAEEPLMLHDFTVNARSLLVNPLLGGLKKDLTILLASKDNEHEFQLNSGDVITLADSLLASQRHQLAGPHFSSLSAWAQTASFLADDDKTVKVPAMPAGSRFRPAEHWPHGLSDGWSYSWLDWAQPEVNLQPVMVDARWHFYFSYFQNPASQLRSHLLPRVCLWNPLSVDMQLGEMIVMMPNPFWQGNNYFHFVTDPSEVARLQQLEGYKNHSGVQSWADGKIRFRSSAEDPDDPSSEAGLFPNSRYLVFVLQPAVLAAGECLVYSPQIDAAASKLIESAGIRIGHYRVDDLSLNKLSADAAPNRHHFYHDRQRIECEMKHSYWSESAGKMKEGWVTAPDDLMLQLEMSQIQYYEPWALFRDNFPFVLKSCSATAPAVSARQLVESSVVGPSYPTIQLLNHGNGGAGTYPFYYYARNWGDSRELGNLHRFADSPVKHAPVLHQIGAKLLTLDESSNEANQPPLRVNRWGESHLAYQPAVVANWNLRPAIAMRSPASPSTADWYTHSSGGWILQFVPSAANDAGDQPAISSSGQSFNRSVFGRSEEFGKLTQAVLFDLPAADSPVVSLAAFRHAKLSPFSWAPSYLIGNSLADGHAPARQTAHDAWLDDFFPSSLHECRWDSLVGGNAPYKSGYGLRTSTLHHACLLESASYAPTPAGGEFSLNDEIYAFDLAYEVNHALWDEYFLSTIQLENGVLKLEDGMPSYFVDQFSQTVGSAQVDWLDSWGDHGEIFWHEHAGHLYQNWAFNVNSTSVRAWASLLAGCQLGHDEENTRHGTSSFSRTSRPLTKEQEAFGVDWTGCWQLSDEQIYHLAECIVEQVKARGPFISMADFVNRRLARADDDSSKMGALQAAIEAAGLNDEIRKLERLQTSKDLSNDANRADVRFDVDRQPESKAWGTPAYLTQGDLLEPLAPFLTARGDTFLIRAYGEASDGEGGKVRVCLEAVVQRTHEYLQPLSGEGDQRVGNSPLDARWVKHPKTGELIDGGLSELNKKFGRRFRVVRQRWLHDEEF